MGWEQRFGMAKKKSAASVSRMGLFETDVLTFRKNLIRAEGRARIHTTRQA